MEWFSVTVLPGNRVIFVPDSLLPPTYPPLLFCCITSIQIAILEKTGTYLILIDVSRESNPLFYSVDSFIGHSFN